MTQWPEKNHSVKKWTIFHLKRLFSALWTLFHISNPLEGWSYSETTNVTKTLWPHPHLDLCPKVRSEEGKNLASILWNVASVWTDFISGFSKEDPEEADIVVLLRTSLSSRASLLVSLYLNVFICKMTGLKKTLSGERPTGRACPYLAEPGDVLLMTGPWLPTLGWGSPYIWEPD